jgi:hypothetical protein
MIDVRLVSQKPLPMLLKLHTKQALMVLLSVPVLLSSCATYNKRMATYYHQLENMQYNQAMRTLDKTKFIQRDRNKLLYFFEKGKLYHLIKQYDSSNSFFNKADHFIETERKNLGDIAKANLINPMMTTYLGEDMERFMMHYYKGLNYLYINQTSEAVVEARRITLANNAQSDKFNNKTNRYSKDAFTLNLQGMIYEAAGDINNAFIAYRNAANVYLQAGTNYYGVKIPQQLKQDVLRTANQMGFAGEQQQFEKLFNTQLQTDTSSGGYLILFIEKGLAPVKREKNFYISHNNNGINGFFFTDEFGNQTNLPFDYTNYSSINRNDSRLESFRSFRVAIPYYEIRYFNNTPVKITVNNSTYTSEIAQDINTVATSILRERMLKELADALARQIVKKLAEVAVQKTTEEVAKNNSKEKDEQKKKEKAKNTGEIAGLLINILNTATEKADTRNWQSLPAYIQYVRIPLQKGENTLTIVAKGKERTIKVEGTSGLQFLNKAVW